MDQRTATLRSSERHVGFLFEALLARLPEILDEHTRTGKVTASKWGRVLTQDVRKLHLARKARG